jgi:hypothetical protein
MYKKKMASVSEFLGSDKRFRLDDLFSSKSEEKSYLNLYWNEYSDTNIDFPSLIVLPDNKLEDFYVEIATFFPENSPITAYSNVIGERFDEEVGLSVRGGDYLNIYRGLSGGILNVSVSLAIAETYSNLLIHSEGEAAISFSACRRSLSYCVARARFLYPSISFSEVSDRWAELRHICRMPTSDELSHTIQTIFSILSEAPQSVKSTEMPFDLITLISSLDKGESASDSDFSYFFSNSYEGLSQYSKQFSGSFDDRIFAFEGIAGIVKNNSKGLLLDSICLAFFANSILPGSLGHLKLLSRYSVNFPTCILWYGLFAGLSIGFEVDSVQDGIGRKLLRDIRNKFDASVSPQTDISLDELRVLSRIKLKSSVIKPLHQRAMLVSLYPGVEVLTRFLSESGGDLPSNIDQGKDTQNARHQQAIDLIKKAQKLLEGKTVDVEPPKRKRKPTSSNSRTKKTSPYTP